MTSEVTPAPANTTETITTPVVMTEAQPQVSSPVVMTEPTVEETPAAATEPPAQGAEGEAGKPALDPIQKRFNEITAKRYEAERAARAAEDARKATEAKNAELLAELAKRNTTPVTEPAKAIVPEEEIEKRAKVMATQIAQTNEFNKACNNIAVSGKAAFKDTWDTDLKNLNMVGALGQGAPTEFLETVVELKSPEKILHHLGQNLEEAERIVKLPPKKMTLEMARIEAQLNAPAPVATVPISHAPTPVIPVAGTGKVASGDLADPNLSMDDFIKLRAAQKDERQKRYQR